MKKADVENFRTLLMGKREEIMAKSSSREDLWIVKSNEQIEMVQLAGQREFTARTLEHKRRLLNQIGAALKRIDHGEFGICLDCEEPISSKRLAAVPWAAYCLHCQELLDAQETPNTVESDPAPQPGEKAFCRQARHFCPWANFVRARPRSLPYDDHLRRRGCTSRDTRTLRACGADDGTAARTPSAWMIPLC